MTGASRLSPTEREQLREQLEAAFRRLDFPADPDREVHLHSGVRFLCDVDMTGPGVLSERYRQHPSKGGRPTNVRAKAVSILTAYTYERLTGKRPTLIILTDSDDLSPQGPFYDLTVEVFRILGLKESPEYYARLTWRAWRRNGTRKTK